MCLFDVVGKYKLEQEVKDLFAYVRGDEWVGIVEEGVKENIVDALGKAITPLTLKVL